jgi:hypothetical protein
MLRSPEVAQSAQSQPATYHPTPVRVRLGLEETAYAVQHLTVDGFSIIPGSPRTPGAHSHVSFQLDGGLSISFEVVAHSAHTLSGLQRFDFIDADPDLIQLLLTTAKSDVIH